MIVFCHSIVKGLPKSFSPREGRRSEVSVGKTAQTLPIEVVSFAPRQPPLNRLNCVSRKYIEAPTKEISWPYSGNQEKHENDCGAPWFTACSIFCLLAQFRNFTTKSNIAVNESNCYHEKHCPATRTSPSLHVVASRSSL
jgi:hypothetical protein